MLLRSLALLFLAASPPAAAPQDAPEAPRKPVVAVIGASVSAGFSDIMVTPAGTDDVLHNRTLRLEKALAAAWPGGGVRVRNYSDMKMFMNAEVIGEAQVRRAVRAEPDLVVAVDFLFWYGYRFRGGDRDARLRLQQQGLEQLDRLECPVVVGDYPDMRSADPRMLPPAFVPSPETLAELNRRLRAWADDRPRVVVFPLAELVADLREKGAAVELDGRRVELTPRQLMQTDKLHATRLGMAVLVSRLAPSLDEALPEASPLRVGALGVRRAIERLELMDEVEEEAGEGSGRKGSEAAVRRRAG